MAITLLDAIKIYKKKTALVIDDYPAMRGSIRRMLDNFGIIRCDTASNGEEAILKCEQNTYDIILADYNLGENKNGQQVLEELRYKNLLKNTAIYMMITAETTKDMVFGAFEYQPDDYLAKPFTQGVLQKRLDRMVMEKECLFPINNAMDNNDLDRSIALCQQRINKHDKYEQRCYRIMASCFYKKGEYTSAEKIYSGVLKERKLEWATIGLGKSLMALEQLDKATTIFESLIDDGCLCLEIFDCLAEIKYLQGSAAGAQLILERAIKISPNAIIRQERLADIYEFNKDWISAGKSRRKVIRLSNNSVYDSPENYLKLARCICAEIIDQPHVAQSRSKEATETLLKAKQKYKYHENIELHTDIIEANILACTDAIESAREQVNRLQREIKLAHNLSPQLMFDLAATYQSMAQHDEAQFILKDLARTYQDDDKIGETIDKLSDETLSQKGKEKAIVLNDQGKALLANKDYQQAILLFSQAIQHYPNNVGLNLNLMLALVRKMSADGSSAEHIEQCKDAIDKLTHITNENPLYERYKTLCSHFEKIKLSA
jgi:CheY-like chemotaxis protein